MPFITHFRSPEGDLLPIAAAAQYTVEIPAAGSEDLKGWWLERDRYMRLINLEGVTEEMAVHVGCGVDAIFTEHGLYVTQDAGDECLTIELELSSLPAAATCVYLLTQHAEGGGAVYMPVVGQGGSGFPTEVFDLSNEISLTQAWVASKSTQKASYSFEYDTTAMRAALRKGAIKLRYSEGNGNPVTTFAVSKVLYDDDPELLYDVINLDAYTRVADMPYHFSLHIYDGRIECFYTRVLPKLNDDDDGKVLTAENGLPVWKEPTGSNTNIITADSVDDLPDPSTVPEGTIGLVPSEGVVLTSPNGTKYRLTVSDDGTIAAVAV